MWVKVRGSLTYLAKEPTLGPLPQKFGGRNISGYFLTFRATKLKLVILEIETFFDEPTFSMR